MKMSVEVELAPIRVPDHATLMTVPVPGSRAEGFVAAPTVAWSIIPAETLDAMCDEFRHTLFSKANKLCPPRRMPSPDQTLRDELKLLLDIPEVRLSIGDTEVRRLEKLVGIE